MMMARYSILGSYLMDSRNFNKFNQHSFEVCKSLKEIYITFHLSWVVQWAETDYGLSAGQHAVLPEGKGKGKGSVLQEIGC